MILRDSTTFKSYYRWCRCGYPYDVILGRFPFTTKVRLGRHSSGSNRMGKCPSSVALLHMIYRTQGLDWHGPSAADAFSSVTALSDILSANCKWKKWGFDPDTRVVLMGHSNGGQGAWYMAARWPDRVCGGAYTHLFRSFIFVICHP